MLLYGQNSYHLLLKTLSFPHAKNCQLEINLGPGMFSIVSDKNGFSEFQPPKGVTCKRRLDTGVSSVTAADGSVLQFFSLLPKSSDFLCDTEKLTMCL